MTQTLPDPSAGGDPMLAMLRASSRVVAVQPWMVRELGIAAVWFSQLLWFMETHEVATVIRGDHEWEPETGMNRAQVLRAKAKVIEKGWITCNVRKVRGTPTSHIALVPAVLEADLRTIHCPISDTPGPRDTGQTSSTQMGREGGTPSDRAAALADEFQAFYDAYPRKKSPGDARKAFTAARKKASAEEIMAGLAQFVVSVKGKEAKFIAYPATWLNGERWRDEPDAPSGRGHGRPIDEDRDGPSGEVDF